MLQAGIAGVQDALEPDDQVQIMLHLDAGANNAVCRWFLDNLQGQGVAFDVSGLTYYPWWQGSLENLFVLGERGSFRFQWPGFARPVGFGRTAVSRL
ncbi:MAG: glycosyl hydrolase 53 family protein [Chloroflexi bacterium]|nr:glycosyl hydrolase 53 family protein [Chloroflexota bacterium]MBK8935412.1 glycosyl hydrolase 53 family protein [Chloroflexota bacterium]